MIYTIEQIFKFTLFHIQNITSPSRIRDIKYEVFTYLSLNKRKGNILLFADYENLIELFVCYMVKLTIWEFILVTKQDINLYTNGYNHTQNIVSAKYIPITLPNSCDFNQGIYLDGTTRIKGRDKTMNIINFILDILIS